MFIASSVGNQIKLMFMFHLQVDEMLPPMIYQGASENSPYPQTDTSLATPTDQPSPDQRGKKPTSTTTGLQGLFLIQIIYHILTTHCTQRQTF